MRLARRGVDGCCPVGLRNIFFILLSLMALTAQAQGGPLPLLTAADKGNVAEVQALLAKGSKVNVQDNRGRTALMLAAGRGHRAVVDMLLSAARMWRCETAMAIPL